jgi:hypothetical protein
MRTILCHLFVITRFTSRIDSGGAGPLKHIRGQKGTRPGRRSARRGCNGSQAPESLSTVTPKAAPRGRGRAGRITGIGDPQAEPADSEPVGLRLRLALSASGWAQLELGS